jgi:hypothetical protein
MNWILISALIFSIILNVLLAWYSVRAVRMLASVIDTLENLFIDIGSFSAHIEGVYELETFYGDQTLENLLSHSRALVGEFEEYKTLFSLMGAPIEKGDFDDEEAPPPQQER